VEREVLAVEHERDTLQIAERHRPAPRERAPGVDHGPQDVAHERDHLERAPVRGEHRRPRLDLAAEHERLHAAGAHLAEIEHHARVGHPEVAA
jgi:hypothetical protein